MLIQIINIDKIDNNLEDYTFLGKRVKQVERFLLQTSNRPNRTKGLFCRNTFVL